MKTALEYFEEIMTIPRESGKEEKIANYLVDYAKKNNIEYKLGKYNTIFLKKNNNSNKTIILQAHSDMVCVSTDDYDFDNKGIPFYIDGDYYRSKNTSLGADDGIGLAIILTILQEKDNMPNIEVIITTQEETTMIGARNFDYSLITSNTLISLDGINEGDIESSCAGMCSLTINKKITLKVNNENSFMLKVKGLAGGHSGDDMDKGRCNAVKLLFKLIKELEFDDIIDFDIGTKDNVIPCEGYISFTSNKTIDELNNTLKSLDLNLSEADKNMTLEINEIKSDKVITESNEINNFINKMKDSLLETYEDNFPLLSANIGKIRLNGDNIEIKYGVRSSDKDKENKLLEELEELGRKYHFNIIIDVKKPFFTFRQNSKIRDLLANSYKKLYGKDAVIKKVHACMEGGILANNIPNLDIVTIAPTISNCHSINENVSISSTKRVYEWLKDTLIEFNK